MRHKCKYNLTTSRVVPVPVPGLARSGLVWSGPAARMAGDVQQRNRRTESSSRCSLRQEKLWQQQRRSEKKIKKRKEEKRKKWEEKTRARAREWKR